MKRIDINKGDIYRHWTVLEEVEKDPKNGGRRFKCQCSCGEVKLVSLYPLTKGESNNCNKCRPVEWAKTHGLYKHKLYKRWKSMKRRCNEVSHHRYSDYGGRGIKVCKEWEDFSQFVEDMYPSFREGLTLDRIDNSGNYCKENCRWSSSYTQANNTRKSVHVKFEGNVYTISELSRYLKKPYSTIYSRYLSGNYEEVL